MVLPAIADLVLAMRNEAGESAAHLKAIGDRRMDEQPAQGAQNINIPKPSFVLALVIQRTTGLVGYALQASDLAQPEKVEIPGLFIHLNLPGDQALTVETAPAAFRAWVLAHALTECVESVGAALESVRIQ